MLVEVTTPKYKDLFGGYPFALEFFQSAMMPYEAMVGCLSDPSICQQDEENESSLLDAALQNSHGARDFRLGTQYMLHSLLTYSSAIVSPDKLPTNGVLSNLDDAVGLVMRNFVIPSRLDDEAVAKALQDAAFSGGMQALGAIGPIGKVIAAVIGFAVAIAQTVKARKEAEKQGKEAMKRAVFARMPPMQQPSTFTDDYLIRDQFLPLLQGGDWTDIFSPRFESDTGEWVGIKRRYGYAFAPGKKTGGKDEAGEAADVFDPGTGLGIVPGMDQLTSVIQVSLNPEDSAIKAWIANKSLAWPVKAAHVVDVGQFYTNMNRLGSVAWAWATQQERSLDLYKLNVGKHGGPGKNHLHARWKKYCDGGIQFLLENAKAWQSAYDKRFDDLRYVYGMSIACAVGAWRCYVKGGTTYHPEYGELNPGNPRFEMGHFDGLAPGYRCVLHPNQVLHVASSGRACLGSMYDTHIRPALEAVRARQVFYLGHSLACAYVRSSWGAFRDPDMLDLLNKRRATLLKHPDRKLVNLDDVAEGERFEGGDWKDQLRKSGVGKITPELGKLASKGTIEPGDEPAPPVPEDKGSMPFGQLAPDRCGRTCQDRRRTWRTVAAVAGGLGAVGTAGYIWSKSRHEREEASR